MSESSEAAHYVGRNTASPRKPLGPTARLAILLFGAVVLPAVWLGVNNLRRAVIARNETQAITTLATIRAAEARAQQRVIADEDGDGVGEFLPLAQLTQVDPTLTSIVASDGTLGGYRVTVTVGAPERDGEMAWHAVAVPTMRGVTGRRTFYVDESFVVRGADTNGDVPTREQAIAFTPLGGTPGASGSAPAS